MSSVLFRLAFALFLVSVSLSGFSCSKKEEPPKAIVQDQQTQRQAPVLPSNEAEKKEQIKKENEEAKAVVVAKVNGVDITMFTLVREMNLIGKNFVKPGQPITPDITEKVKKMALERVIFEELAIQEAKKQGISVKPDTVNEVVKRMKSHMGDAEAFDQYLKERGLTEGDLRKQIERSHTFELVTKAMVYDKIKVDEAFVKSEYEKNKDRFIFPEKFMVEDIFFGMNKTDELTMKKAKDVLATIRKNNNDFSKLPDDGSFLLSKGRVTKERHPAIYGAIANMNVGEVSDIIKDADGLHIIKVVSKEPARNMSYAEASEVIRKRTISVEGEKKMKEWGAGLRKKAKVEILLAEVEKKLKQEAEAGKR